MYLMLFRLISVSSESLSPAFLITSSMFVLLGASCGNTCKEIWLSVRVQDHCCWILPFCKSAPMPCHVSTWFDCLEWSGWTVLLESHTKDVGDVLDVRCCRHLECSAEERIFHHVSHLSSFHHISHLSGWPTKLREINLYSSLRVPGSSTTSVFFCSSSSSLSYSFLTWNNIMMAMMTMLMMVMMRKMLTGASGSLGT